MPHLEGLTTNAEHIYKFVDEYKQYSYVAHRCSAVFNPRNHMLILDGKALSYNENIQLGPDLYVFDNNYPNGEDDYVFEQAHEMEMVTTRIYHREGTREGLNVWSSL